MQIWLFITQAITHPLNLQIQKKKKKKEKNWDQQKRSRGSRSLLETTTKSWLTDDPLWADGILGPKENWGQNGAQKLKVVE